MTHSLSLLRLRGLGKRRKSDYMPDRYGIPTIDEMFYSKRPGRQRKTSTTKKTTKKEFKLTMATRRLITNEVGKCENCGDKKSLEVHHIKKQSEGGGHTPSNLIVLCHDCHKNKAHRGSLSATEQRRKIKNRSQRLQKGIKVILDKAKNRQKTTSIKKPKRKTSIRRQPKGPFDIDFTKF